MERHQHATDKLARAALKEAGKRLGMSYAEAIQSFRIEQGLRITAEFWSVVEAQKPGQYNRVDYCMGCRKFMLAHDPIQPMIQVGIEP